MITAVVEVGDRCELHPATDAWMRGDRFGTVAAILPATRKRNFERVQILMDVSGKIRTFRADLVLPIN